MGERIQLISQGRRAPFFRAPDLASRDHPWAGFSFEEADGPGEPLPAHSWSKTTLLYVTRGQGSLQWKHRGVWNHNSIEPGTVSIMRRDVEVQSAVPKGPFRLMVLQFNSAELQDLAPEQIFAVDRSLTSPRLTQDPQLAALMSAMCAEVKDGCQSGRLYGESISIALLAYLANRCSAPQAFADRSNGLSPSEMRTLVNYVRENLASDISVTQLAALVRISPSRFARVFRNAFGITPYRFVMRERVARAKEFCAARTLPASQVAMEVGFSNQSHFVKVFRQFTGVTPKQFKAGL